MLATWLRSSFCLPTRQGVPLPVRQDRLDLEGDSPGRARRSEGVGEHPGLVRLVARLAEPARSSPQRPIRTFLRAVRRGFLIGRRPRMEAGDLLVVAPQDVREL